MKLRELESINYLSTVIKGLTIPVAILFIAISSVQAQTTFSNNAPIVLDDVEENVPTVASPYPSNITVSGLSGAITKVTVTLNSVQHRFPDDVDILLVSPNGTNLIIMSDAGGFSESAQSVTLTFDDAAAISLPDAGPLASGTYKPINYAGAGSEAFPLPAPAPSANTTLSAFNGTNPNGAWSLYVVDDEDVYSGSIAGGWSLTVTTAVTTAASVSVSGRVLTAQGRGLMSAFVTLIDQSNISRTVRTTAFGYYRFEDVQAGQSVTITVASKRYQFAPQAVNVNEEMSGLNFLAEP